MKQIYRTPINMSETEQSKNRIKLKFKEQCLKKFIKEYSILDIKTITFNESEEKNLPAMVVYYYVEIETSEL